MTGPLESLALVAVGDELLAGAHPDLNSPWLAARLGELGLGAASVRVVPDDEARVAAAVTAALAEAELVVVTGGLGPTLDDVTRHGIARALGRELVSSERALADLDVWFQRRGVPMPEMNRRQALLPAGAELLRNRLGTAPGFRAAREGRFVVALPGPPAEVHGMVEDELVPWLCGDGRTQAPRGEHRFHLFGLPEGSFAQAVGDWMDRDANPRMGCTVKKGVLSVVLRARGADRVLAARVLLERADAFRGRFAAHVFSETEPRLERVLGEELLRTRTKIAIAESCTGGLVAGLLTRVPGISAVFERGWVTYSNAAKHELLGVEPALLERNGAVSAEVAEAMAIGAAQRAGARLSIAVTGVAGPDGGTEEKPVGLVWFATSLDGRVRSSCRRFPPGEREWIRTLATRSALHEALARLRDPGGD
jgi:nicotinamide-nucleotide amidase